MKKRITKVLMLLSLCCVLVFLSAALAGCSEEINDPSKLIEEGNVLISFDCNGGKIGNLSVCTMYAMPGSPLPEPGNKDIAKNIDAPVIDQAYELEGWFTGAKDNSGNVEYDKKWDFKKDKVESGMTLYAKWIEKLKFVIKYNLEDEDIDKEEVVSYFSHFIPDEEKVMREIISVGYEGYTFVDFYTDEMLTAPLRLPLQHNGTVENNVQTIYARFIKGQYKIVRTPENMANIGKFTNLFIMNDIDMTGAVWNAVDVYSGTIKSDGSPKKISNITYEVTRSGNVPRFGLFRELSGAVFENVIFENCSVTVRVPQYSNNTVLIGLLAGSIGADTQFRNVTISGSIKLYCPQSMIENENIKFETLYGSIASGVSLSGLNYSGVTNEVSYV